MPMFIFIVCTSDCRNLHCGGICKSVLDDSLSQHAEIERPFNKCLVIRLDFDPAEHELSKVSI